MSPVGVYFEEEKDHLPSSFIHSFTIALHCSVCLESAFSTIPHSDYSVPTHSRSPLALLSVCLRRVNTRWKGITPLISCTGPASLPAPNPSFSPIAAIEEKGPTLPLVELHSVPKPLFHL